MAKKLGCASCGGTKKMANGGPINKPMTYAPRQKGDTNQHMGIFGAPQIGQGAMDGKTGQMKKGGVTVSRSVQASCKNGYVRSADGGCVKARPVQFQTGGSPNKMWLEGTHNRGGGWRDIGDGREEVNRAGQVRDIKKPVSKPTISKPAKSVMSKAFPLIKKQFGGSSEKRAEKRVEKKITRAIKKSVKNSGKIIK